MYYPRLRLLYKKKICKLCMNKFNIKNPMQSPRILSICINIGLGDAINTPDIIEKNKYCLKLISGQNALITKAKKSISTFKLRKGMPIGLKLTLRKNKMWEFLDRFINISLPRVKDFQVIQSNFDGHGNLTIGIKDNIIFPEISYKDIDKIRGMNISIVTTSKTDKQSKFLLNQLGLPVI